MFPSRLAEHKLSLQIPGFGHLKLGGETNVNKRVVMLQVASETLLLKGRPQNILVHAIGLLRPCECKPMFTILIRNNGGMTYTLEIYLDKS